MQALLGDEVLSIPPLPPLPEDKINLVLSSLSHCDEIEANVAPPSSSSGSTLQITAMDDIERGSCVTLAVEETEVVEEGDADAVLVAFPASEFPIEKPKNYHTMTNHDELLNANGYDSDGEIPFLGEERPCKLSKTIPTTLAPVEEVMMTTTEKWLDLSKLKHKLDKRGCKATGNKIELLKQLIDTINNKVPVAKIAEID